MPGMRTTEGYRVLAPWRDTLTVAKGTLVYTLTEREGGWSWHWYDPAVGGSEEDESGALLPDLTDPAMLGCLLALVREAWGCAVVTSPDYDEDKMGCQGHNVVGWRAVETVRWMWVGGGTTEAEALVAALESAP